MQNNFVYLRPSRLVYVRINGAYETTIPAAWSKMLNWIERNGVGSALGRGFGLARDNPQTVPASQCRYDACIEVESHFEDRAMRELGILTLPGGPYVRRREVGSYADIVTRVATLHASFVVPNGIKLDSNRPLVTIYLDDPRRFEPGQLRADMCIPVSAAVVRGRVAQPQAAA
jgi:AraC family transcriptional regulator